MPTPTDLFQSLVIGAMASGYLLYGRRQRHGLALLSGVGLLVLPSLVAATAPRIGLTLLLMALPVLRRRG